MKRDPVQVAIIADDLTGAMDAAAPFAGRGLMTRVIADPQGLSDELETPADPADVLSVNTDTRHDTPGQAGAQVDRVVRLLARLKPRILFKKIDSTMRGHVANETVAALSASGRSQAILTPAFPAQGRTVKDGRVFVHGMLLKDTPIGCDHHECPPLATVPDLMRQADASLQVRTNVGGGEVLLVENAPHPVLVADCQTHSDLAALARQVMESSADTLAVGSAGLAEALAELTFGPASPSPIRLGGDAGVLAYVIGSRRPESAGQADRLIASHPEAVVLEVKAGQAVEGPDLDMLAGPARETNVVVIRPRADGASDHLDKAGASPALADSVARLAARVPLSALVVTGGDTALAVLRRLGKMAIIVKGELRPGVVIGLAELMGRRLWVVTKAGGFGDGDLFLDIGRYFRAFRN